MDVIEETGRRFGKCVKIWKGAAPKRLPVHGPNRAARSFARMVRMRELPQRLEMTGGTGNLMVNMCRSGTRQSAQDRALRLKGGPGRTQMHHPNRRLTWFGIRAGLAWEQDDVELRGGTARQRACYRRAVERFLTDPAQGDR